MTLQLLNPVLSCHVTAGILRRSVLLPGAQIMLFLSSSRISCFAKPAMRRKQGSNKLFTARFQGTVAFPRHSDKLTG